MNRRLQVGVLLNVGYLSNILPVVAFMDLICVNILIVSMLHCCDYTGYPGLVVIRECVLNGCGFGISAGLSAVWGCCAVADAGPSHSWKCSLVHLGVVAAPIISVSFLRW